MLLLEIIAGRNKGIAKKSDEFWCLYNVPKLHFFPKYSDNWDADLMQFFGGDKIPDDAPYAQWKPIRAKVKRATEVDYAKPNGYGWFLVSNGTVNFDMTRYSRLQSRRRNTPMGQEHRDRNGEVPVIMADLTFKRIVDMQKVLKALVKVKPATSSYKVLGDDRVRGMSVQQIINGGAEKYDQTQAFKGGVLKSLVMFHGTSEARAERILKSGLRPSKRNQTYYDQIPGFSEQNVYMTVSPGVASNYATREAINDGSDAVILEITLNPMQIMKLLPDEDTMNWFKYLPKEHQERFLQKYPMLNEIWTDEKKFDAHIKNMNHRDQKFNLDWLYEEEERWRKTDKPDPFRPNAQKVLKKHGYTRETIEKLEHSIYLDLMNTFIDAMKVQSLKNDGLAAYPGIIPASQIKLKKSWSIKGGKIKADADSDVYNAASEKIEKTAKYHS